MSERKSIPQDIEETNFVFMKTGMSPYDSTSTPLPLAIQGSRPRSSFGLQGASNDIFYSQPKSNTGRDFNLKGQKIVTEQKNMNLDNEAGSSHVRKEGGEDSDVAHLNYMTLMRQKNPSRANNSSRDNTRLVRAHVSQTNYITLLNIFDQIANAAREHLVHKEYWQSLIQFYCADDFYIRLTLPSNFFNNNNGGYEQKSFQGIISAAVAPHFLVAEVAWGNIARISISLPSMHIVKGSDGWPLLQSQIIVQCRYLDGSMSISRGNTCIQFRDIILYFDVEVDDYESFVSQDFIQMRIKEINDENMTSETSFSLLNLNANTLSSKFGLHEKARKIIELGDIMDQLQDIMSFSSEDKMNSPFAALDGFIKSKKKKKNHK